MSRLNRLVIATGLMILSLHTFLIPSDISADVRLPHVFGSNMVMQREMPLPVWGWADSGENIIVTL